MNRRQFTTFMSAVASVALIPSVAAAERLFVNDTNDGYLNLRGGPGTDYRIIQRMYAGQGVFDNGRQGNWQRVQLPDGTVGWASSRFLNEGQ